MRGCAAKAVHVHLQARILKDPAVGLTADSTEGWRPGAGACICGNVVSHLGLVAGDGSRLGAGHFPRLLTDLAVFVYYVDRARSGARGDPATGSGELDSSGSPSSWCSDHRARCRSFFARRRRRLGSALPGRSDGSGASGSGGVPFKAQPREGEERVAEAEEVAAPQQAQPRPPHGLAERLVLERVAADALRAEAASRAMRRR
jgi:hypothetical protein